MTKLSNHPFFQRLNKIPIKLSHDTLDRSDLELLAIDTYGTKRPEQAYSVITKRDFIHVYTAVSPAGSFTSIQKNDEAESRDRKPFVFPLSVSKSKLYLHDGLNNAHLFHVIVDKRSGKIDSAEILRARVDVEPRYLPPPAWLLAEKNTTPVEEWESGVNVCSNSARIRLLTLGEAARFQRGTFTSNTSDAMYVLNKLPHAIMGAYFADQSIPALFSYRRASDEVSYSDHAIGPFASAGITAGIRRYTHRFNSFQLGATLARRPQLEHRAVRDLVHGVQSWRRPNAA